MHDSTPQSATPCPFCALALPATHTAGTARAFPDAYPLAPGHMLVIPARHVASLFELSAGEWDDVWRLVARVRWEVAERERPDGFNIGVNDGAAAGQTVGHAHVHVIPRRAGDVADPRGGVRGVIPARAAWWEADG
jgi:diadenosine tetraphosphate (Ap4A) HIT family hydrolase